MKVLIRNKITGKYIARGYNKPTLDIQEARIYSRRCDASNSLNEKFYKDVDKAEWELVPIAVTLDVGKKKEVQKQAYRVVFNDSTQLDISADSFELTIDDRKIITSVQAYHGGKIFGIYNNVMWVQRTQ